MTDFTALAASSRPFSPEECAALAAKAGAAVDPAAHIIDDEHQRIYERLWQDEHSEAWLVSFWDARDTGYHDHDGSSGGIYVVDGRVTEEALVIHGAARVHEHRAGQTFSFSGSHIHRMRHDPEAVTIHVYSPPIRSIGSYDVVDGMLRRMPGSPDEESPASPGLDSALAS
jgi:hypothetical protein